MTFSDESLTDKASELFQEWVIQGDLLDLYSRELIGLQDLIDRLVYFKMCSEQDAKALLEEECRLAREEQEAEMYS